MEFTIPEGIQVEVMSPGVLQVNAGGEKTELKYNSKLMTIQKKGNSLEINPNKKQNRINNAAMISLTKHLLNFARGAKQAFEKKLQVVYAHFPVTVEVKGTDVHIKNFLGEKLPRNARVVGSTQVKVNGQEITVSGKNKEHVGQTAANLVTATRIRKKDVRVFQDGIYYV